MFIKKLLIFLPLLIIIKCGFAATSANLTYSNTDFNSQQPGWSDTLTVYNNSSQAVVITNLQLETNYSGLDTSQLSGSIYHPQTPKQFLLKLATLITNTVLALNHLGLQVFIPLSLPMVLLLLLKFHWRISKYPKMVFQYITSPLLIFKLPYKVVE